MARSLHTAFKSCCVRCEPRLEHEVLVVEVEVHCGVVLAGSLVDVDIESVVGLHLQRCLHASLGEHRHRRVVPVDSLLELCTYAGELCFLCLLLLCVVVAWKPPCSVVARHGELSVLFFYYKVVERFLLWKLVAQSHSLVIYSEADYDVAVS